MRTILIRWVSAVATAIVLFLTFRVFVPGLVNLHNDAALIVAVLLAVAIPTIAAIAIYMVWEEDFE